MIGLGEFYTVLNNFGGFPIQDDSVFSYCDLVYDYLFSDCHFNFLYKSPSASSEADNYCLMSIVPRIYALAVAAATGNATVTPFEVALY